MKILKLFVIAFNFSFSHLFCFLFSIVNRRKKKILVYTDSRGFKVEGLFSNRNPFSSYVGKLIVNYNVTFRLMPYKHTTIIDFLFDYEKKWIDKNFDFVVLHCGIVDFSPRKKSGLSIVQDKKIKKVDDQYLNLFFDYPVYTVKYGGDYTASLYSTSFLKSYILPKLKSIKGLIFIEPNPIDLDWNGTYPGQRPDNMNIVFDYVDVISFDIKNVVKLSAWNLDLVREYTTDNIHYNVGGFNYIYGELQGIIDER